MAVPSQISLIKIIYSHILELFIYTDPSRNIFEEILASLVMVTWQVFIFWRYKSRDPEGGIMNFLSLLFSWIDNTRYYHIEISRSEQIHHISLPLNLLKIFLFTKCAPSTAS